MLMLRFEFEPIFVLEKKSWRARVQLLYRMTVHAVFKNRMVIWKAVLVNTVTQHKLLFNFPTEKCERSKIFVKFWIFCILSTEKIMSDNLISVISYFINLSTCKRCFIKRFLLSYIFRNKPILGFLSDNSPRRRI